MTSWIFQGTPDDFQIDTYLHRKEIYWTVKQKEAEEEISPGDVVYIWRSDGTGGTPGGIVAKGKIVGYPYHMKDDAQDLWRPQKIPESTYLFSWDEISGNDNIELEESISKKFGSKWIKKAKIKKIDGGKTIILANEKRKKNLSLRLNDEKTKVELKNDDNSTFELKAQTENSKINIYGIIKFGVKVEIEDGVRLTKAEGMLMRYYLKKDDIVNDIEILRFSRKTNYKLRKSN